MIASFYSQHLSLTKAITDNCKGTWCKNEDIESSHSFITPHQNQFIFRRFFLWPLSVDLVKSTISREKMDRHETFVLIFTATSYDTSFSLRRIQWYSLIHSRSLRKVSYFLNQVRIIFVRF